MASTAESVRFSSEFEFHFSRMHRWHCPACGKKTVWRQNGTENLCGCTSCLEVFMLTTPDGHPPIYGAVKALSDKIKKGGR